MQGRCGFLAGLLTAALFALSSAAMAGTMTYTYDALGRVVSAVNAAATSTAYAYDGAGNRTQQMTCAQHQLLTSGGTLASPNGTYVLNMQSSDGNLTIIHSGAATWATSTGGHPGAYLVMQSNGAIAVIAPQGNVLWESDNYIAPCSTLAMQNDGNLVITDPSSIARWASTNASLTTNNTILPGQELIPGEQLISQDNRFTLQFLTNGNLLLTGPGDTTLWTTNISNPSPGALYMDPTTGVLGLNSTTGGVWSTPTSGHPGAYATVQTDGNFVIYAPASAGGAALWASNTGGQP